MRTLLARVARFADPFVAALLEQPQQLGLQRQRQVADFVEEERAPLGRRDLAGRIPHRAGEGALEMAEQLALQQLGREAGTGDGDERSGGARAVGVDGAGEDSLARAALAPQQDRRFAGGGLEGHVEGLAHRRLVGLQIGFRHDRADLLLELFDLALQPPQLHDPVQHQPKLFGGERLGQVVQRPAAHRLDGRFDGGVGRHDHHVQPRGQAQKPRQQVQPQFLTEPQVQQGHLERPAAQQFQGLVAVAGLGGLVPHQLQRGPQGASETGVIVNHEDIHNVAFCTMGHATCNTRPSIRTMQIRRNSLHISKLRLIS